MSKGVAKVKRAHVDARVFVKEWMSEVTNKGNYTALADRLGLTPKSTYQRQQNLNRKLREAGKQVLPGLPETNRMTTGRLDLNALSDLIEDSLEATGVVDQSVVDDILE
jgi:hypothetical protein